MSTVKATNFQHASSSAANIVLASDGSASAGGVGIAQGGRNRIINGGFDVWQRGTSFTNPTSSAGTYTVDRWCLDYADANPTSASITQQAFTPGNAIAGYEPTNFARSTITTVGSTTIYRPFTQRIEDVRTFAGQQVTLSFWAKADSARTLNVYWQQVFGTGGSTAVGSSALPFTLSTSWARYSVTFTVTGISGKTIGTGSYLSVIFQQAAASGSVLDLWGVQLEPGSVATPFEVKPYAQELRDCQRYYARLNASTVYSIFGVGTAPATTVVSTMTNLPVPLRTNPASIDVLNLGVADGVNSILVPSSITLGQNTRTTVEIVSVVTGATVFRPYYLYSNNTTNAYLGVSAEL